MSLATADLHALAALAEAALAREPVPWTAFEDEVHGPPDVDTPRGHDPVNRIATNLYFAETAAYVAATSPDVVRELVERVLKAEAIVRNLAVEFRRHDADQRQHGLPCRMCDGVQGDHREYCPGRRAVESQP